ncbi:MAG: hypothetical protein K0R78_484 [Pelosinus sp.]|jgi:hypothetical protein|nr:hypothetical protein [Pelosinus sp.]
MEKKGLSHTAYGGIPVEQYKPYVPASTSVPEMFRLPFLERY